MNAVPRLVASGLSKRFGARTVVSDVSIEVVAGEVVGLLGPNGAGKTTTFRMVVGLLSCDSGRITLGADIRGVVLTVDGQWAHSFVHGDVVEMTAAPVPLLIFASRQSFFDVMRDKLHWGLRSDLPR